jgi:hypothetical protein
MMKSSWIGIGFSHHNVPSLSTTATRSSTATAADPSSPHVRRTKSMIACFVGPSRQLDRNSSAMIHAPGLAGDIRELKGHPT